MKKFAIAFFAVALGAASAKSYEVTVFDPIIVDGKAIQPGSCKVDLKTNDAATIKCAKTVVDATVRVEQMEKKNYSNSLKYEPINGQNHLKEIRLGGTNLKLHFEPSVSQTAGSPEKAVKGANP
jgi:hypothetical protein